MTAVWGKWGLVITCLFFVFAVTTNRFCINTAQFFDHQVLTTLVVFVKPRWSISFLSAIYCDNWFYCHIQPCWRISCLICWTFFCLWKHSCTSLIFSFVYACDNIYCQFSIFVVWPFAQMLGIKQKTHSISKEVLSSRLFKRFTEISTAHFNLYFQQSDTEDSHTKRE